MLQRIRAAGGWKPGDRVLDVGCGNGRLAIPLCEQPGSYLGLEPIEQCVSFCREAFAPWPHLRFEHLDIANAMYNPTGKLSPQEVTYPVPDGSVDVVLFCSIFTHAQHVSVCRRNLQEAWRVLSQHGKCFTSWFSAPPNTLTDDACRTVFPVRQIVDLIAGWKILHSAEGLTTEHHDQWILVLEKT